MAATIRTTKISEIDCTLIGQTIILSGWIKYSRGSGKKMLFLRIYDGTCLRDVQCILTSDLPNFDSLVKLHMHACVSLTGTLVTSPKPQQPFELQVTEAIIHGDTTETYPIPKIITSESLTFLRTVQHLRMRTSMMQAMFRIRSACTHATHDFFRSRGFVAIQTPILTKSDCEGAGEMFSVSKPGPTEFFGEPAYLTVSGQIDLEPFIFGLCNVYTFGPTFRAENSHTTRHLAEFWMVEPEMAFVDRDAAMQIAEDYVKFVIKYLLKDQYEELFEMQETNDAELIAKLTKYVEKPWIRISYTEAVTLLQEALTTGVNFNSGNAVDDKHDYNVIEWGMDLAAVHEKYLVSLYGLPTFVFNYPAAIKSFYMKANDDGVTVASFDLLVPEIGELIGGSQREDDLEKLLAVMAKLKLDPAMYAEYIDLRRFGSCPHSGFGLGFERLIRLCTSMGNIRDVCAAPRYPGHI